MVVHDKSETKDSQGKPVRPFLRQDYSVAPQIVEGKKMVVEMDEGFEYEVRESPVNPAPITVGPKKVVQVGVNPYNARKVKTKKVATSRTGHSEEPAVKPWQANHWVIDGGKNIEERDQAEDLEVDDKGFEKK